MSFKEQIKAYGKQMSVSFSIGEETFSSVNVVSARFHYEANLLDSCMKCLDLELDNVSSVTETVINGIKIGCKAPDSASEEFLQMGTYIVKESEYDDGNRSLKLTCYDKMLESMIPYDLQLSYPMTVKGLLDAVCNRFGWKKGYTTFTNDSVQIEEEKFDASYTFRSVLDEIAQVSASIIVFDNNDVLQVRYVDELDDSEIVSPDNLKTLEIGELFGPVNSVILARTPQEDNIFMSDGEEVTGEIRIENNQIMDSHRDDFLPGLFAKLKGLQYYAYSIESFGIGYLQPLQQFTITTLDGSSYRTVLLCDDFTVGQGVNEILSASAPEVATTDYTIADETDQKMNQTILRVDKQSQEITSLITRTHEMSDGLSSVSVAVNQLPDSITTQVLSEMTKTDEWQTLEKNITSVTATASGLQIEISGTTSNLQGFLDEFYTYFQVAADGLHISAKDSPFETLLGDSKLSFIQSGTEVAYIQYNRLYITEAWVKEGLAIGDPTGGKYIRMYVDANDVWCVQIMGG